MRDRVQGAITHGRRPSYLWLELEPTVSRNPFGTGEGPPGADRGPAPKEAAWRQKGRTPKQAPRRKGPADDGGRRERARHAALLPLGLLLPDVPVAHLLQGLDRELGAALAVHLVAQSGGGRLVARLDDGGDERSAQLL